MKNSIKPFYSFEDDEDKKFSASENNQSISKSTNAQSIFLSSQQTRINNLKDINTGHDTTADVVCVFALCCVMLTALCYSDEACLQSFTKFCKFVC